LFLNANRKTPAMHTMTSERTRTALNSRRRCGARWPGPVLVVALALSAAMPAAAAETAAPAAKPTAAAKPAGKAETAGIIVLDGKAPPTKPAQPTKGAEASTGIGLGGCASCDKTPAAGQKKPAAAAQDKSAVGK
jgi:hypothetical protein